MISLRRTALAMADGSKAMPSKSQAFCFCFVCWFFDPMDARETCIGSCVVAGAYAAVSTRPDTASAVLTKVRSLALFAVFEGTGSHS